jgi:hypothetical protein
MYDPLAWNRYPQGRESADSVPYIITISAKLVETPTITGILSYHKRGLESSDPQQQDETQPGSIHLKKQRQSCEDEKLAPSFEI